MPGRDIFAAENATAWTSAFQAFYKGNNRVHCDQGQHQLVVFHPCRLILTSLAFVLFFIGPTWGQIGGVLNADDVQKGHALAITVCAICHVAAPDQPYKPILKPPAPSFASIVRRKTFDADSLAQFMTTTHRGLDNPKGMPNPELMDFQIKEIVAYFLSLQGQSRATH